MFFQHILKPKELSEVITNVAECLFVISAELPERSYDVAVYKYNKEYFVLNDPRIFELIETIGEIQGDKEELLPQIEMALEDNLYFLVQESYIQLDLRILAKMQGVEPIDVQYYEFIEL